MIVACSLVNMTTWRQAQPIHEELRKKYKGPDGLAVAGGELEEMIRPLGLWRRRGKSLRLMSTVWNMIEPTTGEDVLDLPGCGSYASDSWMIFVEGKLPDKCPIDNYLSAYWRRLKDDKDR